MRLPGRFSRRVFSKIAYQGFAPLLLSYASRQGRCLLLDGEGEAADAFFALDSLLIGGYTS
jgi:hypothetical protein